MSSDWSYERMTWYMTRDYKDLYRFERCAGLYRVVRYFDCKVIYEGRLNDVLHFMNIHCMSHKDFSNRSVKVSHED